MKTTDEKMVHFGGGIGTFWELVLWGLIRFFCSCSEPSDMVKIARTAGRMTGRAVGRLIVARRQLDEILGQSAATQVCFDYAPF